MAVQRVLLSVVMLLGWTCGIMESRSIGRPEDSKAVSCGGGVIPAKLKEAHSNIISLLSLTDKSVGDSPIFSSVSNNIMSFSKHEQIVLMNHTLGVYLRILSSILRPTSPTHNTLLATPEVRTAVANFTTAVAHLKTQYYSKDMEKMKTVLNKLDEIQVNDLENQKKALAEFKEIYTAASKIVDKKCPGSHSRSQQREKDENKMLD